MNPDHICRKWKCGNSSTAREHEGDLGGWLSLADALVVLRKQIFHCACSMHFSRGFCGVLSFLGWLLPGWWGSSCYRLSWGCCECHCPCNPADVLKEIRVSPTSLSLGTCLYQLSLLIGSEELFLSFILFFLVGVMCVVCLCGTCVWRFMWVCRPVLNARSSFSSQCFFNYKLKLTKNMCFGAGAMAYLITEFALQAWGPELGFQDPYKKLDIAGHTCNPSIGGQRRVDHESSLTSQLPIELRDPVSR